MCFHTFHSNAHEARFTEVPKQITAALLLMSLGSFSVSSCEGGVIGETAGEPI